MSSRDGAPLRLATRSRSEEHTSELQSHSEISYAVFCLKKKKKTVRHSCRKRECVHTDIGYRRYPDPLCNRYRTSGTQYGLLIYRYFCLQKSSLVAPSFPGSA